MLQTIHHDGSSSTLALCFSAVVWQICTERNKRIFCSCTSLILKSERISLDMWQLDFPTAGAYFQPPYHAEMGYFQLSLSLSKNPMDTYFMPFHVDTTFTAQGLYIRSCSLSSPLFHPCKILITEPPDCGLS